MSRDESVGGSLKRTPTNQLPVVLLALTALAFRFGLRRLRGLALLVTLVVLVVLPAGATVHRMGEVIRVDGDVKEDVFAFDLSSSWVSAQAGLV